MKANLCGGLTIWNYLRRLQTAQPGALAGSQDSSNDIRITGKFRERVTDPLALSARHLRHPGRYANSRSAGDSSSQTGESMGTDWNVPEF